MTAGKLTDLRGKFTRLVAHDGNDAAQAVVLTDRDRAFQDHEHSGTRLTRREEAGTARIVLHGTEAADAGDLRLGEHRKHLMAPA